MPVYGCTAALCGAFIPHQHELAAALDLGKCAVKGYTVVRPHYLPDKSAGSRNAVAILQTHYTAVIRKILVGEPGYKSFSLSLLRAAWERYIFPSANGFYRHYLSSFAAARIKLRYSSAARSVLLSPKV